MGTQDVEVIREAQNGPWVWHSYAISEVEESLRTSVDEGLTTAEARARLEALGPNELKEAPRPSFWARLARQFSDFLVIILIVASVVSVLLGDYIEAAAIIAIVILNAALGVIQESRAEQALAALRKMTAPEARVIRDRHQQTIPARELVPGDLVLLETGNYVPADLRLTEAVNLQIDESSLTGESVPVQKEAEMVLDREAALGDRRNASFMGSVITYGRGQGVVVSTGMETQIGQIAEMIQSYENEPTPLQRKLDALGRTLGLAALGICVIVFGVGVGRELLSPTPGVSLVETVLDLFIVAVSLAIAAVPEGLPAVVTINLALGMQRMSQRHALLRRLPAVEALGSATAICSDKTGTLTQNAMTVVQLYADDTLLSVTGEGYAPKGKFIDGEEEVDPANYPGISLLLRAMLLSNDARLEQNEGGEWAIAGDPTEGALLTVAAKAGYWREEVERDMPRVAEVPFDSERKRMTTVHDLRRSRFSEEALGLDGKQSGEVHLAFTKGAPDLVLALCNKIYRDGRTLPLREEDRERVLELNASLASNALRVLAAAVRVLPQQPATNETTAENLERDLVFIGLVGMIDPARPEVKPAVAKARNAGIRTVMITGDYPNTAVAIAREIGLARPDGKVLTGQELDRTDEEALRGEADQVDIYARVSPEHKVRIVEALRDRGHIVAMTGDGVNDAPALKRADIGIAMGITGTDVSKETADMVLTDDNYASIVSAVEEGRIIYSNIRKFVFYLLSCNVGEILVIFLATVLGWPLPLTALQLLVLNLITDGAPALALGLEKGEPDIMDRPPRDPDEPVINREMIWGIVIQSLAIAVAVLVAFRIALDRFPDDLVHARTLAFATLAFSELLRAYTARSEHFHIWQIGIFTNKYMQYGVLSSLVVLLAIIYIPALDPVFDTTLLTLQDWATIFPLILLPPAAAEISKIIRRREGAQRVPAAP